MAAGSTYAAWSPETGSGGGEALFLSHLRAAARAAPHSAMAVFHERMSLMNVKTSSSASTRGKFVMWVQLQDLVDAYTTDTLDSYGLARGYAKSALMLHNPMRTIDPAHPLFVEHKSEYEDAMGVTVPAWRPLLAPTTDEQDDDWFVKTLSCPTNESGSACFADSLFVLMFVATDKFDPLLLVEFKDEPQGFLASEGYNIYSAFTRPTWDASGKPGDEDTFNAERVSVRRKAFVAVRDAARRIAWGMRPSVGAAAVGGGEIAAAVGAFRDALQSYAPALHADAITGHQVINPKENWAERQESSRDIFEFLREQSGLKKRYEILTLQVRRQEDGQVLVAVTARPDVIPVARQSWLDGEVTTLQGVFDNSFGVALPDDDGIQYLCEPPASGTLMIQMQGAFEVSETPGMTKLAQLIPSLVLPDNRQVVVTFGIPLTRDSTQRITYRIVGVLIHSGGTPTSGHFTCYFWRGDAMYFYNDGDAGAVLQRIAEDERAEARAVVVEKGVLMFLERV